MQKHIKTEIELLKILAIFAVIANHIFAQQVFVDNPSSTWWVSNFILSATRWAVPIFIITSGYFLLNKEETILNFYKKRITKIAIPLITWSVFYLLFTICYQKIPQSSNSIIDKLSHGQPYFHLYFLFIMIGLYLLTPLYRIFSSKFSKHAYLFVIFLAFAFSIVWALLNTWGNSALLSPLNLLTISIPYIGYFLFGGYIKKYITRLSFASLFFTLAIFLLAYLSIVLGTYLIKISSVGHRPYLAYFYNYLSISVVVMSISLFIFFINTFNKLQILERYQNLIISLGGSTLGVYLIHPALKVIMIDIVEVTMGIDLLSRFYSRIILYLSLTICSFLVVAGIRQMPLFKHTV